MMIVYLLTVCYDTQEAAGLTEVLGIFSRLDIAESAITSARERWPNGFSFHGPIGDEYRIHAHRVDDPVKIITRRPDASDR